MPRPTSRRWPADPGPLLLVGLVLLSTALVLLRYGADGVGGSDSAGYLGEAQRWRAGALTQPLPFPSLPADSAAWLQSPLGFRPTQAGDGTVPIYPPGWPLLLAAALTAGQTAAVRFLPAACALTALVALYLLGRTCTTRWHAAAAVACWASAAPFLFQALQPMSDVPALAAWLVALAGVSRATVAGRAVGAFAAAIAVAVRPNLAPLLLPVVWLAAVSTGCRAPTNRTAGTPPRRALPIAALVSLPALFVGAAYLWWQATMYGSPWQSGYGTADQLFSLAHIWPNITTQSSWLVESLGWPTLLLLGAGVAAQASGQWPRPLIGAIVIGWALYLVYVPFDNWTYLRFVLLPLALLTLAGLVGLDRLTHAMARSLRLTVLAVMTAACVWGNVARLRPLGVFEMYRHESRFHAAASFVDAQRDPHPVVLAGQHSGAVAAYTQLPVLRVDLLSASDARRVIPWLHSRGHSLAIVLDDEEAGEVRARLGQSGLALDWPPRARIGRPGRTRVWFLADAQLVRNGGRVTTHSIWPAPRR